MTRFILALFLVLAVGCYAAPKEGLDLINDSIAVTSGHSQDAVEFSPLAREAFEADHDAWQKVRLLVYGVEVSPEVQARTDARAEKAAPAPEDGQ